jgi:predicted ester cyclase
MTPPADSTAATPDLRDFYERYIAMLNAREFDRLDEFFHEEVEQNGKPGTRDEIFASLTHHTEALPDFVWNLQDLVIEGDRIAARLLDTGTPTEEWLGLNPTGGVSVEFTECAFYKVRDGRFESSWYLMDGLAVQAQLGG